MPGKRGYWYAYEWIHRKWRAFGKEMFKLGVLIPASEHESIHNLSGLAEKINYMNERLIIATMEAAKLGFNITELVQF